MGFPENEATDTPSSIVIEKAALRRSVRRRLTAMGAAARSAALAQAAERLGRHPLLARGRRIALFMPLPDEPPVLNLRAALNGEGRRWLVPAWDGVRRRYRLAWLPNGAAWSRGPHGVRQPRSPRWARPQSVDAIVVPGVAFDRRGVRLGRGGGHYDRLLRDYRRPAIGIAIEGTLLPRLPSAPHDERVRWVVTERRCIRCRPGRGKAPRRRGRKGRRG